MIFSLLALFCFAAQAVEITPTTRVAQSIEFSDDMSFKNLDLAVERQLRSASYQALKGKIKFGTKVYPKIVLRDSLVLLKSITAQTRNCLQKNSRESCMNFFNKELNAKFAIYRPVPKAGEQGHQRTVKTTQFTSYYSPDLIGSRVRTDKYTRAIYKRPTEAADQNHTRVAIDYHGALEGKGLELFYVDASFYDIYLLHVQGGGRIKIMNADGSCLAAI